MSPSVSSRPGICAIDSGSSPRKPIWRSHGSCGNACCRFRAELVDLPAEVHVLEQRLGQRLELRALLGRHRVHELLHLRHRLRHLLEQLVERSAGCRGKKSPWRSMNPSKSGSSPRSRCSSIWLSSASMSFIRAMRSGVEVLHALGHLVEVALHQLLAQLVHELLELLARGVVHPLVLLERLHLAGEVGRELVELFAALLGDVFDDLLLTLVAATLRVVDALGRCPRAPCRRCRAAARRCPRTRRRGRSCSSISRRRSRSRCSMSRRPMSLRRCGRGAPAASSAAAPR